MVGDSPQTQGPSSHHRSPRAPPWRTQLIPPLPCSCLWSPSWAVPGPSVFPSGEPGVSGDFWALSGLKGVQPPLPFGERTRDCSPGHAWRGPSGLRWGDPQKSPDTPGSPEGNTEGPGTASSEPLQKNLTNPLREKWSCKNDLWADSSAPPWLSTSLPFPPPHP